MTVWQIFGAKGENTTFQLTAMMWQILLVTQLENGIASFVNSNEN